MPFHLFREPVGGAVELSCEEGCGCRFPVARAFILNLDGADRFFCCSDCADTFERNLSTEAADILRSHVGPGQVVADLGCGSGHYTTILAELVGEDGLVYATDTVPQRVHQTMAALKLRKTADRVVAQVSTPGLHAFIPDASLDFVLSNNVLCCTNDRHGEVREIDRMLKSGGTLFVRAVGRSPAGVRSIEEDEWAGLFRGFRPMESEGVGPARWRLVKKA